MAFFQKLFGTGPSPVIGLDIGSSNIKLARLSKSGNELRLLKMAVAPTPSAAIKDGLIVDVTAVADRVKELVSQNNINSTKLVVSSVAGQSIVIRTIVMPVMTDKEIKNSIRYEAERYIPYSVADAHVEGIALRRPLPDDAKSMEVLLAAALKEMVHGAEEVIRKAGFQVQAIDLESFALLRIIRNTLTVEELGRTVALINIGASSTSISIIKDSALRSSRTIALAGNALTRAIAQGMNLSLDDAEKLKKDKGVIRVEKDVTPVAPASMRIFSLILPVLTELVTEIQRSFDFYRSRYQGESVDHVYLSGGTTGFKNLDHFFAGELGLPVEFFNPFRKFKEGSNLGRNSENAVENAQAVAVVLGLASWYLE